MSRTPASRPAKVRCAIYTRKSSEEGLDQAFNSLQAQREACEAYVLSQAGEGWTVIKTEYADGGFSGGNMDRPGLRRLLDDIGAGKIDVAVVYKVDRLTRSLTDFARIVDRFDAAGASFVSVTQAFNTTTSMGRLTLNVLLSFAQFEREVTGERIRDKIAASKAKGMWMGGALPLGYDRPTDPVTRALVPNESEAETVSRIFRRYLEVGSAHKVVDELAREGVRSKAWVTAKGRSMGGLPINRGALFHLLRNRVYLGHIVHKTTSYPGAHPAIVDQELFDKVQARLLENARKHRERPTRASTAPLRSIISDADGRPMCPTFTRGRHRQIYRYYASAPLVQGHGPAADDGVIRRLPADTIEALVLDRMRRLVAKADGDWSVFKPMLRRVQVHADTVQLAIARAEAIPAHVDLADGIRKLTNRLEAGERVEADSDDAHLRVVLPTRLVRRGGRTWLTGLRENGLRPHARIDPTLVKALRTSHALLRKIGLLPMAPADQLRSAKAPSHSYERKLIQIALLAPDFQVAILEGRQSQMLNLDSLVRDGLPLAWADQRAALGF